MTPETGPGPLADTADEPATNTTGTPGAVRSTDSVGLRRVIDSRSLLRAVVIVGAVGVMVGIDAIVQNSKTGHVHLASIGKVLVIGCANALFAAGIVLIYRASRVINFAHAGFGVVASALFYELLTFTGVTYWLALPAAVLAAAVLGGLMEVVFVRRFSKSARLVLTVATIGVGQLLAGLAGNIGSLLGEERDRPGLPSTPLSHFRWRAQFTVFTGNDVLLVAVTVVALIGLAAFFRRTKVGIAVRGAAENADRASLLGIDTRSLSTLVWAMAAMLSGLAAALLIPIFGYSGRQQYLTLGLPLLIQAVAAAVLGSMENLPITVAAALGIAVFEDVVLTLYQNSAIFDVAILVLIAGAFIVQRRKLARTDETGTSTWAATEEVRPIPAELARLPSVRAGARRFVTALAIVAVAYPFVMSPSQTNLGSLFMIDGIVVISLVILTGWGGQISLGQYAFVGVGAFVGGALTSEAGWPFGLAMLAGGLAGAALAIVLGLTALRVRGLYLAVTTLAFAVAVRTVVLNKRYFGSVLPGRIGRPVLLFVKTEDERAFYYLCMVALGLAWYAALGLRRSRTGRVLIATRDNERAAQAFGVNLVRTRLVTFALSGFLASVAGVLFSAHQHAVIATAFEPDRSIHIFLVAIIGGLGSIQGALLGAVYFVVIGFVVHSLIGQLLASALGVLFVLLFFPGGLGSVAYAIRDAILRRVAIRRRIYVPSLLADFDPAGRDRAPLAPRPVVQGRVPEVPRRYRVPSRVRVAGGSQTTRRWSF